MKDPISGVKIKESNIYIPGDHTPNLGLVSDRDQND